MGITGIMGIVGIVGIVGIMGIIENPESRIEIQDKHREMTI